MSDKPPRTPIRFEYPKCYGKSYDDVPSCWTCTIMAQCAGVSKPFTGTEFIERHVR